MDLAKVKALCPGPEELVRTFPQSCATDPMAPFCASDDHSCAAGQGPLFADGLPAGVLDSGCGSVALYLVCMTTAPQSRPPCLLPAFSTPSSLSSQPRAGNLGPPAPALAGSHPHRPHPHRTQALCLRFISFQWHQGKEAAMAIIPRMSLRDSQQR